MAEERRFKRAAESKGQTKLNFGKNLKTKEVCALVYLVINSFAFLQGNYWALVQNRPPPRLIKDEYREILSIYQKSIDSGKDEKKAAFVRDKAMSNLASRYEKELMNPEEALRLGSVSRLVMPGFSRKVLGNTLLYLLRHYQPSPMVGTQRE